MLYRLELFSLQYNLDQYKLSVVSGYVFELFAENSGYHSVQWILCGAEEVHNNE
jgi:hypothetical protein